MLLAHVSRDTGERIQTPCKDKFRDSYIELPFVMLTNRLSRLIDRISWVGKKTMGYCPGEWRELEKEVVNQA